MPESWFMIAGSKTTKSQEAVAASALRIAYITNSTEGVGAALPIPDLTRVLRDRGAEVRVFALEKRDGLVYFNLRETIRRALLEAGVVPENITVEEVCTADNLGVLYSHRGEKGQCGLFGAVLGIMGDK